MVRIGESMLKSRPVRRQFTRVIIRTIEAQCELRGASVELRASGGIIFVHGDEDSVIEDALQHSFGVYAVDPYTDLEPSPEAVAIAALEENQNPSGSFAVRCKRHGEKGNWTSQIFAAEVGSSVLERVELKVNLSEPDWQIRVALFPDNARLLGTRFHGPGGLPIGVQGIVDAQLDCELDILSAWLMMHRGCRINPLSDTPEILKQWDPALASPDMARRFRSGPAQREGIESWGIVGHRIDNAPTSVSTEDEVLVPIANLEPLVGWSEEEIANLRMKVFS
ncbi:MAG: THUMP domain-containing protein, partial [Candidatus Thermoplasmatota archaeon]|nr:THUMP domain-containing protein [Candidatus Thermoplasmatota archaeon]MED5486453.1 THUMP domain-containing protein [Candidatus Thermoplasmatota archaeon]